MRLPSAHLAIIDRAKVVDYLLDPSHRVGGSKARFFSSMGFARSSWETLADALRAHGQQHEVSSTVDTGFGPRYEVTGELDTPSGRRPRVTTVWQVDAGRVAPRLITAYPSGTR